MMKASVELRPPPGSPAQGRRHEQQPQTAEGGADHDAEHQLPALEAAQEVRQVLQQAAVPVRRAAEHLERRTGQPLAAQRRRHLLAVQEGAALVLGAEVCQPLSRGAAVHGCHDDEPAVEELTNAGLGPDVYQGWPTPVDSRLCGGFRFTFVHGSTSGAGFRCGRKALHPRGGRARILPALREAGRADPRRERRDCLLEKSKFRQKIGQCQLFF